MLPVLPQSIADDEVIYVIAAPSCQQLHAMRVAWLFSLKPWAIVRENCYVYNPIARWINYMKNWNEINKRTDVFKMTPHGHLVSPLVCRGPWMSTVVLYCWYHSDSASVLLYFTLMYSIQENIDVTINERPEKLYM